MTKPDISIDHCIPDTLTARQHRFVQEYVQDPNATRAAILAGYSQRSARAIGSENLRKPEIALAVKMKQAVRSARLQAQRDQITEDLAKTAFFDLFDVVTCDSEERLHVKITKDFHRVVRKVKCRGGQIVGVEFQDRVKALVAFGKHMGFLQ